MDLQTGIALGVPLGLGLAALGVGIGLGHAVGSAMEAIGRQPDASNKIMINMTIGCAFIEAVVIYVLVFSFILSGKL